MGQLGRSSPVTRVGGLADTIIDANDAGISAGVATGIQFIPVDGITLQGALARTQGLYNQTAIWRGLQERGMASDVSWGRSAEAYANLYKSILSGEAR